MLKQDQYAMALLVSIAWRYSQCYVGGHLAGQMIIHTIMNRHRAGHGSLLEVIDNVPKYIAENEMPPLVHGSVWSPEFIKLLQAVPGIVDGSAQDLSKGALYWADLGHIERPWFQELISGTNELGLRQHPLIANIGSLSFFR